VYVSGLKEEIVTSPTQVLSLIEKGVARRHVGETNMNAASSRSHTIFRMVVESRATDAAPSDTRDAVLVATLNLVDLAGSERVLKTGAEGTRLKEGANINKSLLHLGRVINLLAESSGDKSTGHIPFRDSKLTRILEPALGGNSKTAVVCNVTPAATHAEETHSTLRFAMRAKRITNNATVNEVVSESALIKRQQREIEELRKKLGGEGGGSVSNDEINALRREMLEAELERERLANELEQEREERDKAQREASAKIDNLTKLVLRTDADAEEEKKTKSKRGGRRETWAPNQSSGVPDFLKGRKLPANAMKAFDEEPTPAEAPAPALVAEQPVVDAKARAARRRGGFLPPPPRMEELAEEEDDDDAAGARRSSAVSDVSAREETAGVHLDRARESNASDAAIARFDAARRGSAASDSSVPATPDAGAGTWGASGSPGVSHADHAAAVAAAVAAVRANMEAAHEDQIASMEASHWVKVESLEMKLKTATESLAEANIEKNFMERDIERLTESAEQAIKRGEERLEEAKSSAAAKLAAAVARASDAEAARSTAAAQATAMVEANKLTEAKNSQLRAEISAAQDAAMLGASEAANEARAKAEAEVESARAATEAAMEASFKARTAAAVAAARAELEAQNEALTAKISEMEETVSTALAQKAAAEEKASADAKAASEARAAKAESTRLAKELKSASVAPKQLAKESEMLRKDLEKVKEKAKSFEEKYRASLQDKAGFEADKKNAEKELKRLKATMELKNAPDKKDDRRLKIANASIETKTKELESLKKEMEDVAKRAEDAAAKATAAEAAAFAADEAKVVAESKLSDALAKVAEAEASRTALTDALAAKKAKEEEARALADALSKAEAKVKEFEGTFREVAAARDAAVSKLEAMENAPAPAPMVVDNRTEIEDAMRVAADATDAMESAKRETARAKEELLELQKTFEDSEHVMEEAVSRAEEESRERARLELLLASGGANPVNVVAADNTAHLTKLQCEQLERRAVRAEDRLLETEKQLARAAAELSVAAARGTTPASASHRFTPGSAYGGNHTSANKNNNANGEMGGLDQTAAVALVDAAKDECKKLQLELKERKRQMHKMQEVYGRLKDKFAQAGGDPEKFDAARDVNGLRYELQYTETKRAAERKRAEGLALELGKAQRELEGLKRAALGSANKGERAVATGSENAAPV
jgi:centromeric protein E